MKKQRIYRLPVPLSDDARAALKRLAKATNASMGATAGAYFDSLVPQLNGLAEVHEALKEDPSRALKLLHKLGLQTQQQLTEEQLNLLDDDKE